MNGIMVATPKTIENTLSAAMAMMGDSRCDDTKVFEKSIGEEVRRKESGGCCVEVVVVVVSV
jgi:hypothetical protein